MKYTKLFLALALVLTLVTLASCSFVSSLLPQPKSAYEIAVENGFTGSEAEWLASLKGNDGNEGNQGKSAYELYCELFGYEGTEEQWLIDLRTGALISFNVTYDLDGGEAPEGFVAAVTVPGGSFLDLKAPTREGYTFVGWWTGDGDTDFAMTATTAVRSDLTLTAKWRKDVMSVRFLDKDGKLLKQENVPCGGAATAPKAPEVADFLFQKWDVDFSAVTEDLTVKAVYSPLYTLSFDTDGGTEIADSTYISGEVPATPADPQNGDLVFRGWYADAAFTVPYDFSAPLTQNTTVYAYFSDMKPISNAEELKAIGDNSTGKFYLTNDINLGGEVWTPLVGFAGEFDGRGYKIHNFIISEAQSAGFFTTNSGTIQNLTLADFAFTVSNSTTNVTYYAGALVGNNEGVVDNCHITDATISCTALRVSKNGDISYSGGIIGVNCGTVSNSSVTADLSVHLMNQVNPVVLRFYQGGAVGGNEGKIENVTVDVNILGTSSYSNNWTVMAVGGVASYNLGTIQCSSGNADIVCEWSELNKLIGADILCGGFVFRNEGTISQCDISGSIQVKGRSQGLVVGGFVSENWHSAEIKDCSSMVDMETSPYYTDGNKSVQAIGGFAGMNYSVITASYSSANIATKMTGSVGGFVGRNESGATVSKSFANSNIIYEGTPVGVACFVGFADNGGIISKNYYSTESKIMQGETDVTAEDPNATAADLATLQSKAFLVDTFGWNAEVWEIVDGQYPTLIKGE